MADLYEAMKKAQAVVDEPEKWEQARLQAFDEMCERDHQVIERAYAIFDDMMEKKRKRSEAAKKNRCKRSQPDFYDPSKGNEHQEDNQQQHGDHQVQ